ncbi:MAG: hypothetical protein NZ658_04730, partial [Pirellulales bacterium]|nr:hypothetical protein [Pirellulales bacterium]
TVSASHLPFPAMMPLPLSCRFPCRRAARSASAALLAVLLGLLAGRALAFDPPPVVFEGLGLGGFEGSGSVAAALRQAGGQRDDELRPPLEFKGIVIQGPSGPDATPGPMSAEVRSRLDRIDLAAGVLADPAMIGEGPSRWTGRIGVASNHASGRESLELRTMLAPGQEQSLIGVMVGPRVERRLGRGITFFIDGQAEAQAVRPADTGWWTLPGTSTADLTMLGVTARTGLVR